MSLVLMFNAAFAALVSTSVVTAQTQYPNRMPRGSGNHRPNRWRRYFIPDEVAPMEPATNYLTVGDIESYVESYEAYLDDGEIIATVSTEITDNINLVSGGLNAEGTRYAYTIEALRYGFNQIKITATTDEGRVDIRRIDFQVSE